MINDDVLERFSQNDGGAQDEGDRRNEKVADWLRGCHKTDVQEPERGIVSLHGLVGTEHIAAEQYAVQNGCWIDNPYSLGHIGPNGDENECFVSQDGSVIYKVNVLTHTGGSILRAFDKVRIHNLLFPETRYDFVGFTNMGFARSAFPVFCQVFIKDAERASKEEISEYMTSLGFVKDEDKVTGWRNAGILVWELLPKNVLKDRDGNLYVVDAELTGFR